MLKKAILEMETNSGQACMKAQLGLFREAQIALGRI